MQQTLFYGKKIERIPGTTTTSKDAGENTLVLSDDILSTIIIYIFTKKINVNYTQIYES